MVIHGLVDDSLTRDRGWSVPSAPSSSHKTVRSSSESLVWAPFKSPYYLQADGKFDGLNKTFKTEGIRPTSPLFIADVKIILLTQWRPTTTSACIVLLALLLRLIGWSGGLNRPPKCQALDPLHTDEGSSRTRVDGCLNSNTMTIRIVRHRTPEMFVSSSGGTLEVCAWRYCMPHSWCCYFG